MYLMHADLGPAFAQPRIDDGMIARQINGGISYKHCSKPPDHPSAAFSVTPSLPFYLSLRSRMADRMSSQALRSTRCSTNFGLLLVELKTGLPAISV
jgi:hypothetical protein